MKKQAKTVELGTLQDKIGRCPGVVVGYGGGVDSTALLIHLVELGVKIDAILFADTGSEVPRTYEYVTKFSAWLVSKGYPAVTIVRNIATRNSAKGAKKGQFESLGDQLMRLGNLPPAAFGAHTCAQKMKIRPQDLWLGDQTWAQEIWARGGRILKLIGFEDGEGYRAQRSFREMPEKDAARFELHFPLIEWGWNREKCEQVIAEAGLPSPGKSACYFCPFRKLEEILELRDEYPDLYEKALELEQRALTSGNLKKHGEFKGLGGRKFSWKSLQDQPRRTAAWGHL